MGYYLINGKRYYKDDRTGRVTVDNVSQEEAERRERPNWTAAESSPFSQKNHNVWWWVLGAVVIVSVLAASSYNSSHISDEERQIIGYMAETTDVNGIPESETYTMDDGDENETYEGEYEEYGAAEPSPAGYQYLLPDSDSRYLDASEAEGHSGEEIQRMINEIYARHGRVFERQDNIDYFMSQEWYEPIEGKSDDEIVSEFNEFEKANVDMLSQYL